MKVILEAWRKFVKKDLEENKEPIEEIVGNCEASEVTIRGSAWFARWVVKDQKGPRIKASSREEACQQAREAFYN